MALFKDDDADGAADQENAAINAQIEKSNQTMQEKRDKLFQTQLDLIKGESSSYAPETINGGSTAPVAAQTNRLSEGLRSGGMKGAGRTVDNAIKGVQ